MNDKVLIKVFVSDLDEVFDCFIPVNELVWKIKLKLVKYIYEIEDESSINQNQYFLINKNTSQVYSNNMVIIDTDIRNVTELILVNEKNIK